ncbi:MAG TPA: hypothetical protein IAC21_05900 [Candidatus Enterenecus merdae]|nr:hypothetical protein [Candidatus Enterenecus merdae]
MSELEEKLEGILSNPKAMEQIFSLAQSLGKGSASAPPPAGDPPPAPERETPPAPTAEPEGGGLLGALSQVDPRLISGAVQLMSRYNSQDDGRVALLHALRPFVKERRYARLDQAIQIAKLSRLIRMGLELLRPREDPHV